MRIKYSIKIIIALCLTLMGADIVQAATAKRMPAAYVNYAYGSAYTFGTLSVWESLTDNTLASVTTTDAESSGTTLYVASTAIFDDCETDGTSTVICDGQTLTITGVTTGVSLTVSAITGTIAASTAVSCGAVLTCAAGLYDDSVNLSGATTTSDYFRVIRAAEDARGTPTSGVRFAQSTVSNTIQVSENYAGIYDIAAKSTRNGSGTSAGVVVDEVNYIKIVGCTAYESDNPTTNAVGFFFYNLGATNLTGYIVNCVAKDNGPNSTGYGVFAYKYSTGTLTLSVYNTTTTGNNYGLYNSGSTCYLKNCITQSNTNNTFGTWTATTCITSGATFEADGYHLAYNDTTAYDSGTDLSSDGVYAFGSDIDDETRSDDWDIGCDERIDSVTLDETTDDLADRRVIAYDADEEGAVELTGTYSRSAGAPTHIEARVFNRTTSSTVQIDSSDWTQLTSESISGGSWSGTLSGIPKTNAWLGFEVRFSNDTDITATGENKIGVGYVIAITGQSYPDQWFDFDDAYTPTAHDLTSKFRHLTTGQGDDDFPAYTGWQLNTGAGAGVFANKLRDELECPIGLLDYGMGGSALLEENKYLTWGYWVGDSADDNWYEDFIDGLAISEPMSRRKVNSIMFYHGYTDGTVDVTYQDYYDGLTTLDTGFTSDVGFSTVPVFIVNPPRSSAVSATHDAGWNNVRTAQIEWCIDNSEVRRIFAGAATDLTLLGDGIHLTSEGQSIEALRYAQSVLWFELGTGDFTYHRGPRTNFWLQVDSTHTDVYITHDGGTDFTPTSSIDSFEVYNGSSWISTTGTRQGWYIVRLTHASATTSDVRCLYGVNPDVTNIIVDNTSLQLPIEPTNSLEEGTPFWAFGGIPTSGVGGLTSISGVGGMVE